MSRCDIIIPVWNQPEATKNCIDSIERNTSYPYRLIIIDNASSHVTEKFLDDLKKNRNLSVMLIRNAENEGFIKAVNKGISLSTSEYACMLNNDTVVTKDWLTEMIDIINKDPQIGIVNPSSNNLGQKVPGKMTLDEYVEGIKEKSGLFVELGCALGFCMLTRKKIFDEIGMFDEIFGMGNFEDTDFSMRATKKGYRIVRACGSYVLHEESRSFRKLRDFKIDFARNKKIYETRWGRQERVLFILDQTLRVDEELSKRIDEELEGDNWIYVAHKGNSIYHRSHSRIKLYNYRKYFTLRILLKILFKKKKFDKIYCDDKKFLNLIRFFKPIHRAYISIL